MKYIVVAIEQGSTQREVPIIFPDFMVHSDMAEYTIRQLQRNHKIMDCVPVSAGFITFNGLVSCHGCSESLNLESRGSHDSRLIETYDYMHGIVL